MNEEITAKKVNPLGVVPISKLLTKFAIPSIIAMLVSALYNIVDQFFIGRSVGMLGNAATNVAFPLTMTCTAIALMCGVGGAANFNLCMGAGEKEEARRYVGNAICMLFSLGVLLCLLVRIFLNPMMNVFGATEDVLPYALTYTGITSFGFPFLILTTGGSHLVRADGSPTFSMLCTLTGAIINLILDPVFIFGFDLGMAGAAWATIIGQIVSGLMIILYLSHYKTVTLDFSVLRPVPKKCLEIIKLGMAPCFNQLAMMIVQIVMNNVLRYYGAMSSYGSDIPLACVGIIMKVNMIFFSIVIGISQGLQPIVSFNYGAKQYARVREAYFKAAKAACAISLASFLLFQIFPRQLIGFFGSGSEAYFQFAVSYFRIYLFFTFANWIQPITSNFFTAIGKAKKGVFMSLTRQIIFLLPLIVIFPMVMGIDGIMYTAPVADFMAATLAVIFVIKEMKHMREMEMAV